MESFHLNDKTLKYQSFAQSKRQHQYLGPPGEFKFRLPQEMVFTDMTSARADELYCTDEDLLIDLEEESDYIDVKTLKKFAKYLIFITYWYLQLKGYIAVICHKKPKKEFECFEYAPSLYIHVHYIYFSQEELWFKFENLINKVEHNKTLLIWKHWIWHLSANSFLKNKLQWLLKGFVNYFQMLLLKIKL